MKESIIQDRLYLEMFGSASLMVPNYTPLDWWECDFFSVTKANYMVEHEIKASRSDFFADSKKETKTFNHENGKCFVRRKHDLLNQGYEKGPRQFWFIVPEGLVEEREVPNFAGFKTVTPKGRILIKKKAPFLHKVKIEEQVLNHARSVFYYRYWNLRRKIK